MSDHSAIHSALRLAKPPNIQVTTRSRSYKRVSTAAICEEYHVSQIADSSGDQKKLFKIVNKLLHSENISKILSELIQNVNIIAIYTTNGMIL